MGRADGPEAPMQPITFLLIAALVVLSFPTAADHESDIQTVAAPDGEIYYVTLFDSGIGGVRSVGVRQETNGCPGMQAHEIDCMGDEELEEEDEIIL